MSEPALQHDPEDRHDPADGPIVHEYDGILEADNQLPRWWLGNFFGAIVFGVGYWYVYEGWGFARYQRAIWEEEMALAAESGAVAVDDGLLERLSENDEAVARGRETFQANCVACHGAGGEGVIGPNLTDGSWVHGGAPTDIHRTVRDGFQARGMPPWGPALGERQVQSVVAFVLTLRDTNVAGRAPEGEPWVPGASAEAADGDDTHGDDTHDDAHDDEGEPAP
jgi:cytochrome c oxidase cbb3-type subunit 3